MCGICGWISHHGSANYDSEAVLLQMTEALVHRGPDDQGTWHSDGAWLGHRRLAVIAPGTDGRQPMHLGKLSVVFNGEIYNFQSLRDDLQAEGAVFSTLTDTEVLLHGYQRWGADLLLERVDGMFALALWDASTRRLTLARDKMGEKPLYYTVLGDGAVVFASELRALSRHPEVSREIDPISLRKYLAYDYVPAPRSILRDVCKVEAGHVVVWSDGRIVENRSYWQLPEGPGSASMDPDAASEQLWNIITRAVDSRLISDVPIGAFLSGGLDSTAVVAALCALREPSTVKTFCVGFEDPSFDESEHARVVANHLGTTHFETRLTASELLERLPDIVGSLDEPLADPSIVPTSLLAEFTRGEVTVALGGDGGDELFYGYPTFGAHGPAKVAAKVPRALRRGLLEPLVKALPTSEKNWSFDYRLKRFMAALDLDAFSRHFAWIGGTHPDDHSNLLEPAVMAAAADSDPLDDVHTLVSRRRGKDHTDLAMLKSLYSRLYLGEGVLQKMDRATMAHGLESRAPLLSPEVIAFAASLPDGFKLKGRETKWLLRKMLNDRVPKSITERPKKGFGMPLTAWLKGPLRPLCEDLFDAPSMRNEAVFKAEACKALMEEHRSGWRDHRKTLWALIVFQLWSRSR